MADPGLSEFLVIILLTLIAAFLALADAAIQNAKRSKLKELAEEEDRRAAAALELADNPEHYSNMVRVVSTFILVLLGAHVGSTIALRFGDSSAQLPYIGEYGFLFGFVFSILFLSCFIILFGEIIPRRIGLAYPDFFARFSAPTMRRMTSVLGPIARGLDGLSAITFKMFGADSMPQETVTEEEVKEMIREGTDLGVFEQAEEQMVNKVLRLGDKTAAALMTPRNDIVWLDIETDLHELLNEAYESGHSNFVVARETLDTVLGVISIGDLSRFVLRKESAENITSVLRDPLMIPNTLSVLKVLEQMRETKKHLALVMDEYGGLDGLITTHDLIEAVVGDLGDEDEEEASIVLRSDASCLVDAAMDIDEVLERMDIGPLRTEEKRGYHSLGGFVLANLGHIPRAGEGFDFEGFHFEVIDMDKNRVDKVLIKKCESAGPVAEAEMIGRDQKG